MTSWAAAATFTVNTTLDQVDANTADGLCDTDTATLGDQCSLRAAIQQANALGGSNTIVLPAGVYTLTIPGIAENLSATGDLDIRSDITITGAGRDTTTIQAGLANGSGIDRVFEVLSGSLTISGVTIQNGNSAAGNGPYEGGGIRASDISGSLNISSSRVTMNLSSGAGGGISATNPTMSDVIVTLNTGDSALSLTGGNITNLNVSANSSSGGYAVSVIGGQPTISSSTIQGGLFLSTNVAGLSLTNSTLSGSPAYRDQSIFHNIFFKYVTAVGMVESQFGITTASSILPICQMVVLANAVSQGGNLIGCAFPTVASDHSGTSANLGPIQNNGGLTPTARPLSGSIAIDGGICISGIATDQRGQSRPFDGDGNGTAQCDIGAVEVSQNDVALVSLTGFTPASPANNNAPTISGVAPPGMTVGIYTDSSCAGSFVSTVTLASGIFSTAVSVADNTTTTFYAKAQPVNSQIAPCSTGITYVEDSTPPAAPTNLATNPVSPSTSTTVTVTGSAALGSIVQIYNTSTCTGTPLAIVKSSGTFSATLTVGFPSKQVFFASATDTAGNVSACSTGVAYISESLVSINSITQAEGNSGTSSFVFTVSLSAPLTTSVSVTYATKDKTALAGSDYSAVKSTVTFNPGESKKSIAVSVLGDLVFESDETFQVVLLAVSGNAEISPSSGTGTAIIKNDDAMTPTVGVGQWTPATTKVFRNLPLIFRLGWTVPNERVPDGSRLKNWKDLNQILLRMRGPRGTILQIRWNQKTNTFQLFNEARQSYGPAFAGGSLNTLETNDATLYLFLTSAQGDGPTSPHVTLTLTMRFKPDADGATYSVEGTASDDFGGTQLWEQLGTVTVE